MSRPASTKFSARDLIAPEPGLSPHSRDDHNGSPDENISPQERIIRIDPQTDSGNDEPTEAHSSVHAVYRHVARSRQKEISHSNLPEKIFPAQNDVDEASYADLDANLMSDDGDDGDEAARRTRLAEKLKEIFDLEAINDVLAEMPCWLLHFVLLQGYMYLTNSHLCFFAHIPSRENQILKSGPVAKRATLTACWIKHWFVLKNDTLSWHQSSSESYFLDGIVNLRYAISCDPTGEKEFRLRTNQKNILLAADSVWSKEEWVEAIRKAIFKAQNMGDTVKIAIPYSVVLDVEKSSAIKFSEAIEVRVFNKEEHHSVNAYFFAYFRDAQDALENVRDIVHTNRLSTASSPHPLLDTTVARHALTAHSIDCARSLPSSDAKTNSSFRLSYPLRLLQESLRSTLARMYNTPEPPGSTEDFTHKLKRSIASSAPLTSSSIHGTLEAAVNQDMTDNFKIAFAFDDKETLLGYFPGYLVRLSPIFGCLYVSSNYFCFGSTGLLNTKTKMILPMRDILTVEMTKATRIGHHGLTVMIKGYGELFFEFGVEARRRTFVSILERQIEDMRERPHPSEPPTQSRGKRDALILEEFKPRKSLSSDSDPVPPTEAMSESLPAVMFTSASSTSSTSKPKETLHFTLLTIGSRGDVQPYIALAKGLMADGHRVKVVTHGEFQAWIESHGIEFGYVSGDPVELMRFSVENSTFTLSYWREGVLKFRKWYDDVLKTSWEACQGTDVLVENPSAMAGYHIAEALKIPYFRAQTMTWTRTRAYPHSLAVPERKMGGGYNYLTYVMLDQAFWRLMAGQINLWRRNVLHLDNTSLDRMELYKIPFLYNFSPTVAPRPLDWPEWNRVTGYWSLTDADVEENKWTPPQDLLPFIDSARQTGKKVVYIGFGSIVVPDPKAMTRCIVDAVVQSGVYAIFSKGWLDRLHTQAAEASQPEEPYPKQIYSVSSVPHDWLFSRIDAVCHHGGIGTTCAGLRAGIPIIIKPFFGDQFFWANRIEALGAGTAVRKLTVDSLSQALTSATTDQKQIERARLVGERIRSENGVATAIEAIYRDLDYARSLIKRPLNGTTDMAEGGNVMKEELLSDASASTLDRSATPKRNSLVAAVMSVLLDSVHVSSPSAFWFYFLCVLVAVIASAFILPNLLLSLFGPRPA